MPFGNIFVDVNVQMSKIVYPSSHAEVINYISVFRVIRLTK